MDFDIKPQKTSRQDSMMPQTIEQLIKKYKLDSMWDNIQKIVNEVIQHADFIQAGTLTGDRIKGGTLTLGGENDVNGLMQVKDAKGKDTVIIGKEGIRLADGTKIIGGDGILSVLSTELTSWNLLGFPIDLPSYSYSGQYTINLGITIPENFKIKNAYLKVQMYPQKVINQRYNEAGKVEVYEEVVGFPQNINLFYREDTESKTVSPFTYVLNSDAMDSCSIFDLNTNTNTINASGNANKLVTCISKDISNLLSSGKSYSFQIRSIDNANSIYTGDTFKMSSTVNESDYYKNAVKHSGFARAMLNIYGYLQ